MNNEIYNRTNEQIEIDLLDLFRRALKKWKLCILLAIVCALLGGGFAFVKPLIKEHFAKTYNEEDMIKARDRLTAGELRDADRVYKQYQTYFRLEDVQRDHIEHSVIMSLDPETAVTKTRQYLIDTTISEISGLISQKVLEQSLYDELATYAGDPDYADYVQELVEIEALAWQTTQGIALGEQTEAGGSRWQAMVTLTAMGGDAPYVDGVLNILDKHFKSAVEDIAASDPSINSEFLGDEVLIDGGETIIRSQKTLMESVTAVVTERQKFVTDVVSKLGKFQQNYLEQLELRDDIGEPEVSQGRGIIKMSVVGFILGIFIFFVILLIPYLFGGVIRTEGEMESQYRARNMGEPVFAVGELAAYNKEGTYFLATGGGLSDDSPLISRMSEEAGKCGITLTSGDPLTDSDAQKAMLASNGMILAVAVDKTKRDHLRDICRLAVSHEIRILGYVSEKE